MKTRLGIFASLVVALIPVTASAQRQAASQTPSSYNQMLEIGPLHGLTTLWHRAPRETAVPLGSTFELRVESAGPVRWSGAQVSEIRSGASVARFYARRVGKHLVAAEFMSDDGEWARELCLLDVVDTSLHPVRVKDVRLTARPAPRSR